MGGEFWSDGGCIKTVGEGNNGDIVRNYIKGQGRKIDQLKLVHFYSNLKAKPERTGSPSRISTSARLHSIHYNIRPLLYMIDICILKYPFIITT